jgi:hypothetical protein
MNNIIIFILAVVVVALVSYNIGLSNNDTSNIYIEREEPYVWWYPYNWFWWSPWYSRSSSGSSYYRPPHHKPPHHKPPHHDGPRPNPPQLPRPPHNPSPPPNSPHTLPQVMSNTMVGSHTTSPSTHLPTISGSGGPVTGGHISSRGGGGHEHFTSGCNRTPKNPFLFESIAMEHALPTSQSLPPSSRALKIDNNYLESPSIGYSNYHLF